MSNFICEHCGKSIIDSPHGYLTECKHYYKERKKRIKDESLEIKKYFNNKNRGIDEPAKAD